MEFKKIELTGFKSFVEKTSFFIEKGLTGIVGPNGGVKSNIVEGYGRRKYINEYIHFLFY